MGYMINNITYEVQNCPSEDIMLDNGWSSTEWVFVETLEDFPEYSALQAKQLSDINKARKTDIYTELDILELKRSRAQAEPEIKEIETGETWLDYRTKQIQALRIELQSL